MSTDWLTDVLEGPVASLWSGSWHPSNVMTTTTKTSVLVGKIFLRETDQMVLNYRIFMALAQAMVAKDQPYSGLCLVYAMHLVQLSVYATFGWNTILNQLKYCICAWLSWPFAVELILEKSQQCKPERIVVFAKKQNKVL